MSTQVRELPMVKTAVFKDGQFIGHVIWSGRRFEAPVNNQYLCNQKYYSKNVDL